MMAHIALVFLWNHYASERKSKTTEKLKVLRAMPAAYHLSTDKSSRGRVSPAAGRKAKDAFHVNNPDAPVRKSHPFECSEDLPPNGEFWGDVSNEKATGTMRPRTRVFQGRKSPKT